MNRINLFLLLGLGLTLSTFAQNTMTPELLWKLKRLSPAGISEDQKNILYSVTEYQVEEGKKTTKKYNPLKLDHFTCYFRSLLPFFFINRSLAMYAIDFSVFLSSLAIFLDRLLFKSKVVFLGKILIFPFSYNVPKVSDFIYSTICFYSCWQSSFTGIIFEFFFSFSLLGK